MKKRNIFILIGTIVLIGLSSCESVYDIGCEETDKSLGYRILSDKLVSAWFYDYETGKEILVDSLEKSDWALYLSGYQTFFSPISLEAKRYAYEENLSIPIICEGDDLDRRIDVEIGGLEFSCTYGGTSYVMEPIQQLYIDVGELEPYVDPEIEESGDEKRYSALFSLVTQDMFTGKDILLAQKRAYFLVTSLEKIKN